MRADEAVKKQLDARLRRLRRRAVETAAEIVMVERLLADIENRSTTPNMKLRKNGVAKLSVQSGVRRLLTEAGVPMRAKDLLEALRRTEPNLKASTFRSHLKRMVDSDIIAPDSGRGLYKLAERPSVESDEGHQPRRRPVRVEYSYE